MFSRNLYNALDLVRKARQMKKQSIYSFIEQYAPQHSIKLAEHDLALLTHIDKLAPKEESLRAQFFKEFLNGAYVFIPDDGESYDVFSNFEQVQLINRDYSSSHDSNDTQYAFRSNVLGECLFGTREIDSQNGTWIQLEAYHTSLGHLPAHLYTYAVYVVTGENSGPLGTSTFTEKKPFVLQNSSDTLFDLEADMIGVCLPDINGEPIAFNEVISQKTDVTEMDLEPTFYIQEPIQTPVMQELIIQAAFTAECI